LHGMFSERLRIRHGITFSRLYRTGFHAAASPILRNPNHRVDTQFSLREPVLRHSLRNARHYKRRAPEDGSPVTIVGIRFGNGSEIGSNEPSNCRSSRPISKGSKRAFKPP